MFAIGDEQWPGLSKVIEEAGELLQVAGKLMGSRGDVDHWSGDLRAKLIEELGDLVGAVGFFVEQNLTKTEQEAVGDRTAVKFERFMQWHKEDPEPTKLQAARAEEEFNGEYWEHGPHVVIDLPDEALRGLASAIEARSHDAQTQPGTDHAD